MDIERLFLETLGDLEQRISSSDEYTVLGAAALLRKLLLDKVPLVNQVNRKYKLKITYEICDTEKLFATFNVPGVPPLQFIGIQDALDPCSIPNPPVKIVRRDAFLKTKVQASNGQYFTVRELIKYLANIAGAVHAGKSGTEENETLSEIESTLSVGGLPPTPGQLRAIGRVVLKAFTPLADAVRDN